jgi:hypothetical protein
MFLLLLFCIGVFGSLCLSGCGGKSCEKPKYGKEDFVFGGKASVCSIPGCGGCLTPEDGCNSACWPQSCRFVKGSWYGNDLDQDEEMDMAGITACDIRYYGGGCLGCGQKQKSCYYGYLNSNSQEGDGDVYQGCVYGSSDKGEKIIGCVNGCGGCYGTDGSGKEYIQIMEDAAGVN